jgi:uncharacterized integral membrane protein
MNTQNFRCPICGELDAVRKVSTIVFSETPPGPSFFDKWGRNIQRNRMIMGGFRNAMGNALSAATADPDRGYTIVRHHYHTQVVQAPQTPSILVRQLAFPEISYRTYELIRSITDKVGAVFMVLSVLSICAGASGVTNYHNNLFVLISKIPIAVICITTFVVCALLSIIAPILKLLKKRRDRPTRARAYALWDRLYYCYRNDIVFVGDNPAQHFPASQMRAFLYHQQ